MWLEEKLYLINRLPFCAIMHSREWFGDTD